ncbi:MAG: DUF4105 domain-containing protein [Kofleriaceae bacterium]
MRTLLVAIVAAVVVLGASPAQAQHGRMGLIDATPGITAPKVQLYTFGRGALIFEKFGHTALCLDYNEVSRETACFNYGVTDFTAGGAALTWRFIRGKQVFFVEAIPLSGMLRFYKAEDRTIWRQTLPLTEAQARAVEAKLLSDLDPKNGSYIYDHFVDNCTTRLRDIIDTGSGGVLKRDSGAAFPLTLRDMGRRGMAELPPLIAFGDFAVGRYIDHHPTLWGAMFHPFVLRDEVAARFGVPAEVIYERQGPPIPDDGPTGRVWSLLIGLALLAPLAAARLTGRFERGALAIAAVPAGLLGLVIWIVAIISTIPSLRWNEALLLYLPLDLALPFLGAVKRRQYARVRLGMVVLVSLLRAVGLFMQPLWIPIALAFGLHGLVAFDVRRTAAAAASRATAATPAAG